nr:MV entry-fusion complex protein [Wadden Sea poxvirus]
MEQHNGNIYLSPVFVEPKIKHSLLNAYNYIYIIIFELILTIVLIYIFFKTEIKMLLNNIYDNNYTYDYFDIFKNARLVCDNENMLITGYRKKSNKVYALSLDGNPIKYKDCNKLLKSINGSYTVSINDVLYRR